MGKWKWIKKSVERNLDKRFVSRRFLIRYPRTPIYIVVGLCVMPMLYPWYVGVGFDDLSFFFCKMYDFHSWRKIFQLKLFFTVSREEYEAKRMETKALVYERAAFGQIFSLQNMKTSLLCKVSSEVQIIFSFSQIFYNAAFYLKFQAQTGGFHSCRKIKTIQSYRKKKMRKLKLSWRNKATLDIIPLKFLSKTGLL